MKSSHLILFFFFIATLAAAQDNILERNKLGISLNSATNGAVYPPRIIPSILYHYSKHQFELGIGFHPFIQEDEKVVSSEFNYNFFSNGKAQKFNMYVLASLVYLYHLKERYFPATYHYLFLQGGYGFQINLNDKTYLGTNIRLGAFTYHK